MDMIPVVHAITYITIAIILFYSSLKDFKYRTISRRSVAIVFIIVLAYRLISGIPAESTFTFILILVAFVALTIISRGGFGMGDSLLISAIAFFFGNFSQIQYFIYALGVCGIIFWFVYFIRDKDYRNIKEAFLSKVSTVPINEVKIGSVLATDNFMAGLTEVDIEKLKKSGVKEIQTKTQPMPFIPCIFIAYVIAILI
jgi:Flp pilus assembly protein protease CpaA